MITFIAPDSSPLAYAVVRHPAAGLLTVAVDGRGAVVSVEWGDARPSEAATASDEIVFALEHLFTDADAEITVAPRGVSPLCLAVMKAVAAIPAGQVESYSDVAVSAGYPGAVRAVASAVGRNPIPVIVPCHRVLPRVGASKWPSVTRVRDFGHYTPDDALKPLLLAHDFMLKKT